MRKAGAITTMHCLLHWQHLDVETAEEAVKTVVYGPLTSGQGSFVKHSWYVQRWVKKSVFVSWENNVISVLICLLLQSELYRENYL